MYIPWALVTEHPSPPRRSRCTRAVPTIAVPSPPTPIVHRIKDWRGGSFHGRTGRVLMQAVRGAFSGNFTDLLTACGHLRVLLRNAYNTEGIELELGKGCEIYLNVHGTLGARDEAGVREMHYWLKKLVRVARPFVADDHRRQLPHISVGDAWPESPSWESLPGTSKGVDEAQNIAARYVANGDQV